MKYSLRKSFSSRRRKATGDDDQTHARLDHRTGSNSNLVKANQSKSFLRRRRRYSASPPRSPSPTKTAAKISKHPYNNHVNDADDDDDDRNDPFSSSPNAPARVRPFDKITDQIRKSFRSTLTRQRPRLESNNSNKRLILNTNDENRPVDTLISPISTGLTSPIILPTDTSSATEPDKMKTPPKRRKAPLAPTHLNQSRSVPNPDCSTLSVTEQQESGYVSSSTDPQQNLVTKKKKFNQTFRIQISLLFKKRHAKQQQQQLNSLDEDLDHQQYDDQEEVDPKKQTLGQRFDTLRRSLHLGNRTSRSKGKGYLLSND